MTKSLYVINTLKGIYNHPFNKRRRLYSLWAFFSWQMKSRFFRKSIVHQFTENSKLIVKNGMAGATGNIYSGLHEFEDMGFLLHFLRKNDLFIDIGANIGSYTVLASAETGANVICIEPISSTYEILKNNISINNVKLNTTALNIGLSSKEGTLKFTKSLDTVNHVSTSTDNEFIEVNVNTLDNITIGLNPILIKIDVEGFETEVLNGAKRVLEDKNLKAIIIELNGSGSRYGFDDQKIHTKLLGLDFIPYQYDPFNRSLSELKTYGSHNTIYIRDFSFITERVAKARKIKIQNNLI